MTRNSVGFTTWVCPDCQLRIPVIVDIERSTLRVTVTLADEALADVFTHAWTHLDDGEAAF